MNKISYTFKAIIISVIFWLGDSYADGIFHQDGLIEFIPEELNELWMRVIIVLLFVSFGMYADRHIKMMLKKEAEKREIFNATISSAQHILNNLLHQMQYFKVKADTAYTFDDKTLEYYERSIAEGTDLVKKLSAVDELTEENIKASVYPK